ncbi:hypothetical protein B0J13DRAFT_327708 [Dactylonectria estremocensis]|uniref:Putative transcription factor kapC n=1 Tax=Dactylonectria estremocensis TaxID=1079267 RepID=A0A9P9EVI8_9HYPO|nr:hypothetical protein B0J13DRAFT_327708 [Dactylonectria estremocensis]
MQTSSVNGASTQAEQHLREQLELLKNHDVTSSSSTPPTRDPKPAHVQPVHARASNGYDPLTAASQDVARVLATKSEVEAHIHPDLRARPNHVPTASMMPIAPPSGHSPIPSAGPSAAPLAPAPPLSMQPDDGSNDGRKAKRELSQSKRAAQNRAAQRAFRQRKEGYIKKLEQQVRDYLDMEQSFKSMQSENYALREYVIHLQSQLLDVQGEFPPPPPNVNLSQPPPTTPGPPASAPEPAPSNTAGPLEAVAQAVAGLAAQEQMVVERQQYSDTQFKPEEVTEDTRTAEEINRQLQQPSETHAAASAV